MESPSCTLSLFGFYRGLALVHKCFWTLKFSSSAAARQWTRLIGKKANITRKASVCFVIDIAFVGSSVCPDCKLSDECLQKDAVNLEEMDLRKTADYWFLRNMDIFLSLLFVCEDLSFCLISCAFRERRLCTHVRQIIHVIPQVLKCSEILRHFQCLRTPAEGIAFCSER